MSVKLEFLGKCKDCRNAELDLHSIEFDSFDYPSGLYREWSVSCIHESVCDMWDDRLSEEKERSV